MAFNQNSEVDIEDTLQSFAAEEASSELPSPLMFSRSSSIGSLNSSEQHSIIDDRSSVSILSDLPSGIISPSELPDSPGESPDKIVNSPMIEDIKDSLNNEEDGESDFSVIESDGEADALLEECIRSGRALESVCGTEKYSCALEESNGRIGELESHFNGFEGVDKAENLNSKGDKVVGDIMKLTNKNEKKLEGKNECKNEDSKQDFSMIESDCTAMHLTEKYLPDRKSMDDVNDIKGDKLADEKKQYEETEFCNSLNESDDELDALLEECIRNGKPNVEKSEKVVKLQDILILSQFINSDGTLIPQHVTGLCDKQHFQVRRAVALAQRAGLIPKSPGTPIFGDWEKYNTYFKKF